jgi:hypothetical protein
MKVPLLVLGVLLVLAVALVVWRYWRGTGGVQEVAAPLADGSLYDLEARTLDGEPADLGRHRGRVARVVNVASSLPSTRPWRRFTGSSPRAASWSWAFPATTS